MRFSEVGLRSLEAFNFLVGGLVQACLHTNKRVLGKMLLILCWIWRSDDSEGKAHVAKEEAPTQTVCPPSCLLPQCSQLLKMPQLRYVYKNPSKTRSFRRCCNQIVFQTHLFKPSNPLFVCLSSQGPNLSPRSIYLEWYSIYIYIQYIQLYTAVVCSNTERTVVQERFAACLSVSTYAHMSISLCI